MHTEISTQFGGMLNSIRKISHDPVNDGQAQISLVETETVTGKNILKSKYAPFCRRCKMEILRSIESFHYA